MVGRRAIVIFILAAWCLASCAEPMLDPSPGQLTIDPAMHPFKWTAKFRGFKPEYESESGRHWEVDYQLLVDFSDYEKKYGKFTEIIPAISGIWRYDKNGRYQAGPSTYAISSRFSTTGMPIERFDGWPTIGLLHGKGGSPFEAVDKKPLPPSSELAGKLIFEGQLRVVLPDDSPDGYYEPYFYVLVRVEGVEHPVHLAMFGYDWSELPDQVLPLVSVGDPAPPQMPWTILASEYQLGRSGALPREQKKAVGLISRSGFPSKLILRPGRYLIKPNFPTLFPRRTMAPVDGGLAVVPYEIPHTLMFDRGQVTCSVAGPGISKAPDTQRMKGRDMTGPLLDGGGFEIDMTRTGQYAVELKGHIEDVFARRFEGGGAYDVTIANPITFSTSCKPGTNFLVGDKYPAKVNCIPPTPADVEVTVEFFPNSDPTRKRTWTARGKAGRFGHFVPYDQEPIVFDEPGEYASHVTAKWTDPKGQLWMGRQTSAGVVAPRESTLILHGTRSFPYGQRLNQDYNGGVKNFANRQDMTTSFMPFTPSMLPDPYAPYDPADTLFIPSNGYNESLVEPHLSMTLADYELSRNLQESYREPSYPVPPSHQTVDGPWRYMRDVVQISTDSFAWFPADAAHADELPVIPASDGPFHPFAFPQFATVEAYTYMGVVRPGFPVMTSVYQTDAIGLYWLASPNRFGFHFNNGDNGDLPGDVYRIQAGAVLKDLKSGKNYYDAYSASIAVIPSKGDATSILPAGNKPLAFQNGREQMIFLALDTHDAIEVGEYIGVGGMVFPAIEADALWIVTKPSGEVIEIKGRANRLGIVRGNTAVFADEPGIYSIKAKVMHDGLTGDIIGTKDGVYWHCAVPNDNPPLLSLEGPPVRAIDPKGVTDIILSWPEDLNNPKLHYGLIMPGQVLDQGIGNPNDNRWSYPFEPLQIAAQFPNFDVRNFATGKPVLVDTVVFQFFLEAERGGEKFFDSLRLVLRAEKLYNFAAMIGE